MSAVTVLRKTRDILRAKKRWTQGTFAKDANGLPVHSLNKDAVCFCLSGALNKASKSRGWEGEARGFILECIDLKSLILYNDDTTRKHSEIVATLNAAIKLALADEKAAKRAAKTK
jgi:hypothetical protein